MTLVGFKAKNHPQQSRRDDVDDRGTRAEVFAELDERFRFSIDVAAAPYNAKCERYYTLDDNGLERSWAGERVWCNPPYSDIESWVYKAWREWLMRVHPRLIVMLLPANRTEQGWWQRNVEPYRDTPGAPLRVEFLPEDACGSTDRAPSSAPKATGRRSGAAS